MHRPSLPVAALAALCGLGCVPAQQIPIQNAGFENGAIGALPTGWTAVTGTMYGSAGLATGGDPTAAYEGARFVTATWQATGAGSSPFPAAQTMHVRQDVDLSSWAAQIDVGDRGLDLAFAYNAADGNDVLEVGLTFFDAGMQSLAGGTTFGTAGNATPGQAWLLHRQHTQVPIGARTARLDLIGSRSGAGSARNVSVDDLSLTLGLYVPPPPRDIVHGTLLQLNPNGCWSWYQDERAIVVPARGEALVGSIASFGGLGGQAEDGKVQVCHLDLHDRSRTVVTLDDVESYGGGDDHNVPALLHAQDGSVIAFYAGHNNINGTLDDRSFRRVLPAGGDPGGWGPVHEWHWWPVIPANAPGSGGTTYSNLFQLSAEDPDGDQNGRIYNVARTQQSPHFMYSDDGGATWLYGGQLTERPSAVPAGGNYVNGYYKYWSDGVGRIDLLATEYHPRDFNTSIYHAYIEGGRMFDSVGNVIDPDLFDAALSFHSANVPSTDDMTPVFVADGQNHSRAWNTDVHRYPDGTITALFKTRPVPFTQDANVATGDHRAWYGRFDPQTQQWAAHQVARAGARLYGSEQDYTGLGALDPHDPDTIYLSTEVRPSDGVATAQHELYRGVTQDGGATWTWTALTENSTVDNLRPIAPAWDAHHTALFWWRGSYATALDHDAAVVGLLLDDGERLGRSSYHDASAGNTQRADGVPLVTTTGAGPGAADGHWHVRTGFGNGGDVWTADESGAEDVPTLRTTLNGLTAGRYDVFVCFWADDGDWRVDAGLSLTTGMVFRGRGAQSVDPAAFGSTVLAEEGNRTLLQACLGRVTLRAGQALDVYVDDHTGGSTGRVWYDGVRLAPVAIETFGTGCGAPPLQLRPDALAAPVLGQTAAVEVPTPPSPLTFMMLGWSDAWFGAAPLPLALDAFGMPGCALLQSTDTFGLPLQPAGGGALRYELAIPSNPALLGVHVFLQTLAYAPGQTPLGFVLSNGVDWRISAP